MHLLLDEILTELRGCRADISDLKQVNAEKRGERRVALWLAGAISALVSLVVGLIKS